MFLRTIAALAALTLAACGPQARANLTPVVGDASIGAQTNVKVTVYEYGAPTCPGCKSWHDQFWSQLKTLYIDNNKIKFVFREFPSHNPPVDAAIFSIARCTGAADWFKVIDQAFADQTAIEMASRRGNAVDALKELGAKFQLSGDQVTQCIDDKDNRKRVRDSQAEGYARGVDSTPTFFVNDTYVENPTFAELSRLIEEGLRGGAPPPATPTATDPGSTPPATPPITPAAPPAGATPPAKPPGQ